MEELFAMEELATGHDVQQSGHVQASGHQQPFTPLLEIQSIEDPVLVQDKRVLNNLIQRQSSSKTKPNPDDYFENVQSEIKPHMRKIVCDWMLEVTEE